MSASPAEKKTRWTAAEYLAFERSAPEKHELYDGEIFAMAGASPQHNRIARNLTAVLWIATRNGPCEPFQSDLRLRLPGTENYCYPDVLVVCGPLELDGDAKDVVLNPTVICEVLSASTESYDRGGKFALYRTIPSLTDYVLLSQDQVLIEHFARQPDGGWLLRDLRAGQVLRLSIGCELLADEIYLKVFADPKPAS
jgi:Uma2 family endonuclease